MPGPPSPLALRGARRPRVAGHPDRAAPRRHAAAELRHAPLTPPDPHSRATPRTPTPPLAKPLVATITAPATKAFPDRLTIVFLRWLGAAISGESSSVVDAHIGLFCRVGGVAKAPVTAVVQPRTPGTGNDTPRTTTSGAAGSGVRPDDGPHGPDHRTTPDKITSLPSVNSCQSLAARAVPQSRVRARPAAPSLTLVLDRRLNDRRHRRLRHAANPAE